MFEFTETIESLWKVTLEFMKLHPEHVAKDNSMGFLSDDFVSMDKPSDYNRKFFLHVWLFSDGAMLTLLFRLAGGLVLPL